LTGIVSFGEWVERRRKRLGLTRKALAVLTGCSAVMIQKIERDERRPSVQLAQLLAQHLQIPETEQQEFVRRARGEYVPDLASPDEMPQKEPGRWEKAGHHLPLQATPFIGRQDELNALEALLQNADTRLITIAGPGGIGKTRLAIAAAEKQLAENRFANGVTFVPLASLNETEEIVPAMADALHLPLDTLSQRRRTAKQQVLDYLRQKQMLIVLDNFEHLLDGVGLAAELLTTVPGVTLLATSRERLRLQGEQVFNIKGLDVPDRLGPEKAAMYTAVQLFIQSAQRSRQDFSPSGEDFATISQLCRLVGGMPLAIELAAGWVDALSLTDIEAEIQKSLDFLATDMRNVPVRHRSMQAVFDTTWQQMNETEQTVFCQLSVFRGGFTQQAGQAIAKASLLILSRLVGKSLLSYDPGQDRYQIHELLRQFGKLQLKSDEGREKGVHNRYAAYYCRFLHGQEPALKASRQQTALDEVEAEIGNVRAAWRWAGQHKQVEQLAQAMDSLGYFHEWNGHYQEGERLFMLVTEALASANTAQEVHVLARAMTWQGVFSRVLKGKQPALRLCQQALDLLLGPLLAGQETATDQAFAYLQIALASEARDTIRVAVEKSLALAEGINDRWAIADALECLGDPDYQITSSVAIKQNLEGSLVLRQALGDRRGQIRAQIHLSRFARYQGEFVTAERWAQAAYNTSREMADNASIASSLLSLSNCFGHLAKFLEAISVAKESLHLYQDLGNPISLLDVYQWLGVLTWHGLGHKEEARDYWQKGHALAQEMGLSSLALEIEWNLGGIKLIDRAYEEAIGIYSEALKRNKAVNSRRIEGWLLSDMAYAEHMLGRIALAKHRIWQALRIAADVRQFVVCQFAFNTLIVILAGEGQFEKAIELEALVRSQHPLFDRGWYAKQLRKPFDRRVAELPEEIVTTPRERGRKLDYWQTAESLLTELEQWRLGSALSHPSVP
jgi:predicted ATPase/tetratricopeptide (TPR) repeat protein/DNA-binding XRE family transcriptional regulator